MPGPVNLYPLNDFNVTVTLKYVDNTGAILPLTTGVTSFFLATTNAPTATTADATLAGTAVHIGAGVWLIQIDAAVLTAALLATLFATLPPQLIVQQPNGVRGYATLAYVPSRPMTIL